MRKLTLYIVVTKPFIQEWLSILFRLVSELPDSALTLEAASSTITWPSYPYYYLKLFNEYKYWVLYVKYVLFDGFNNIANLIVLGFFIW